MGSTSARRSPSGEAVWFRFKPAYKNFGQTPAQNIFFRPHIFVVGAGSARSAKETCGEDKALYRMISSEIVFPQEEVDDREIGVQLPLRDIEEQAAAVQAVQPSGPVYLGVVGCLVYQSTGSDTKHVTGFVGDLRPSEQPSADPGDYISVYDLLTEGTAPVEFGTKVNILSAWADWGTSRARRRRR